MGFFDYTESLLDPVKSRSPVTWLGGWGLVAGVGGSKHDTLVAMSFQRHDISLVVSRTLSNLVYHKQTFPEICKLYNE